MKEDGWQRTKDGTGWTIEPLGMGRKTGTKKLRQNEAKPKVVSPTVRNLGARHGETGFLIPICWCRFDGGRRGACDTRVAVYETLHVAVEQAEYSSQSLVID